MNLISIEDANSSENTNNIHKLNQHINDKSPIIIYFYMEHCPYCVTTTSEWNQIPNHINSNNIQSNLLAFRINHILYNLLKNVGDEPNSFPNIRYIDHNGIKYYDKEGIERNASNLAKWIEEMNVKNNFKRSNFKKSNFKRSNFKKSNFKRSNFKKSNFKRSKSRRSKSRKNKSRRTITGSPIIF
jgi:hypothetical protein